MVLLLALSACGKPRVQGIATIEEQDAPLKSVIRAGDPIDELQFASGFYPAEPDGWRWSRGHFSLVLLAPEEAARNGATLELDVNAPQVLLDQIGPVTITASIRGVGLEPETRSRPGMLAYRRFVPASAFSKREVLVDFTLDKVVQPNTLPGEDRELGVAVHGAALLKAEQR